MTTVVVTLMEVIVSCRHIITSLLYLSVDTSHKDAFAWISDMFLRFISIACQAEEPRVAVDVGVAGATYTIIAPLLPPFSATPLIPVSPHLFTRSTF